MDYRFIELCKVGDSSAIEHFVQTYQQDVFRLALSILDDSAEAEDATQEALLAALRSLDSFRGASSLTTWLYSITVNICRTRLQRHRRRENLIEVLGGMFQITKLVRRVWKSMRSKMRLTKRYGGRSIRWMKSIASRLFSAIITIYR